MTNKWENKYTTDTKNTKKWNKSWLIVFLRSYIHLRQQERNNGNKSIDMGTFHNCKKGYSVIFIKSRAVVDIVKNELGTEDLGVIKEVWVAVRISLKNGIKQLESGKKYNTLYMTSQEFQCKEEEDSNKVNDTHGAFKWLKTRKKNRHFVPNYFGILPFADDDTITANEGLYFPHDNSICYTKNGQQRVTVSGIYPLISLKNGILLPIIYDNSRTKFPNIYAMKFPSDAIFQAI